MRAETQEAIDRVTALARDYLESVERREVDKFIVGTIAVVFELDYGERGGIGYTCSDDRYWIHAGLFHAALHQAESSDPENEE